MATRQPEPTLAERAEARIKVLRLRELTELTEDAEARIREQYDPTRFVELHKMLKERVTAAPDDMNIIRDALEFAASGLTLHHRYLDAWDAYLEPGRVKKSKREKRLQNAGALMLGVPSDQEQATARLRDLASAYDMLTDPGGLPENEQHSGLYWWRTWEALQRAADKKPTARGSGRDSHHIGMFFSVPEGCKPTALVQYPLHRWYERPSQVRVAALMVLTEAHRFDSAEACLQALRRARRAGYTKTPLPGPYDR